MKKLLFLLPSLVALTACDSSEVINSIEIEEAKIPMSFTSYMDGTTRAGYDASSDITNFEVYALTFGTGNSDLYYFKNEEVNKGGSGYTMTNSYYWPKDDEFSLNFMAVAPYTSDAKYDISSSTSSGTETYSISVEGSNGEAGQDIIYAQANAINKTGTWGSSSEKTYGKDGIPLNFRHIMSKVTVKIKKPATMKAKVTASKLGISKLVKKGSFTCATRSTSTPTLSDDTNTKNVPFEASKWALSTDDSDKIDYEYSLASSTTLADNQELGEFFFIPQPLNQATSYTAATTDAPANGTMLGIHIDKMSYTASGTEFTILEDVMMSFPLQVTFEPGKHYTLTVDISGGGYYDKNHDDDADLDPIFEDLVIKPIAVTIDSWTDGGTINLPQS